MEKTFGEWIKQRRRQLDLTQNELAKLAECSKGTIRKIEGGSRRPSKELAEQLATALKIPLSKRNAFIDFARKKSMVAAGSMLPIMEADEILGRSHKLPNPYSQFFGREKIIEDLTAYFLVDGKRLITLVGAGGIGKSRLAIALAAKLSDHIRFSDGLFFVPLSELSEPIDIPTKIAEEVGVTLTSPGLASAPPKDQLFRFIGKKKSLLILDNFEHLLEGSQFVSELLNTCPFVSIIVTSRERLNLRSEQVYPLDGLRYSKWRTAADAQEAAIVHLFINSAQQVNPKYLLKDSDIEHLYKICDLVEGMPLAIELAASWTDTLPLEAIATEIYQDIGFLETELLDIPRRHRNIRTLIDSSWQQLLLSEQTTFSQLSVFRGGFDLNAARSITNATPKLLSRLVNKSLLKYDQDKDRYHIHELIRQFGDEKLSAKKDLKLRARARHSNHFLIFLSECEPALKGSKQQLVLKLIETEFENIRLAWKWAWNQVNIEPLLQSMNSLGIFLEIKGRFKDGMALFRSVIKAFTKIESTDALRLRTRALGWQSLFANYSLGGHVATKLCTEAFALIEHKGLNSLDTRYEKAFITYQLGNTIVGSSFDQRKETLLASLKLWQQIDDSWYMANTLQVLGEPDFKFGSWDEIDHYLKTCLSIRSNLGDMRGIIHAKILQSTLARYRGEFYSALPIMEEVMNQINANQLTDPYLMIRALFNLAASHGHLANFEEAIEEFNLMTDIADDIGFTFMASMGHQKLGQTYLCLGDLEKAREFAFLDLNENVVSLKPVDLVGRIYMLENKLELAYDFFKEFLIKVEQNQDVKETSFALARLAMIEQRMGNSTQAKRRIKRALQLSLVDQNILSQQEIYLAIAFLFVEDQSLSQALEINALSRSIHPLTDQSWEYNQLRNQISPRLVMLTNDKNIHSQSREKRLNYWGYASEVFENIKLLGW